MAPFEFSHFFMSLLLQHLSRVSVNVPELQAEVTQALEATATAEAVHVMAVLATNTSAQEATAAWDSTAILVKDAEDQTTLAERGAWERVLRVEVENLMTSASAHEDAKGLVRKVTLLEENTRGLFDAAADVEWQWEKSKRERQKQFEELNLLQTQGSKLCLAIVCPPRVRNHLSEGMRLAAFHHTEMARELAMPRAAVSSVMEFTLGHSPNETFWVEVLDELIAKFQWQEERCSCLERPGAWACDMILGMPSGQAWLADWLEEAIGRLGVEQAARREADVELEAL
jgi:hypothetical protein